MNTSPSSCPNENDSLEEQAKVKADREKEVEEKSLAFLRTVTQNLCGYTGMSGQIDLAFKVDRQKIMAKVLRRLADEHEDNSIQNPLE